MPIRVVLQRKKFEVAGRHLGIAPLDIHVCGQISSYYGRDKKVWGGHANGDRGLVGLHRALAVEPGFLHGQETRRLSLCHHEGFASSFRGKDSTIRRP